MELESGGSSKSLDGELVNTGTLKWLEGNLPSSGGSGDGILRNQSTWNITGTSNRFSFQTGIEIINESGATIKKSDSSIVTLNGPFENNGNVFVTDGKLLFRTLTQTGGTLRAGGVGIFSATGTATHMQGDANADFDTDGGDFLVWQRQFGSGVGSLSASNAVPEPSSILLLVGLAAIRTITRQTARGF